MNYNCNYPEIANKIKEYITRCKPLMNLTTICGHDFVGKTTICKILADLYKCDLYSLPGQSTPQEKAIRKIIKDPNLTMDPLTIYNLFLASDAEFFLRTLNKDTPTILDRYGLSRIVYQHILAGIPLEKCLDDLGYCSNGYFPAITIILTCDIKAAHYRRECRNRRENIDMDRGDKVLDDQIKHYRELAKLLASPYVFANKFVIRHIDTTKEIPEGSASLVRTTHTYYYEAVISPIKEDKYLATQKKGFDFKYY